MKGACISKPEEKLAAWIDPYVIAELIVQEMFDQQIPIDLQTAKDIWLDALEHLGDLIESSTEVYSGHYNGDRW